MVVQELRSREEELQRVSLQQRMQEEALRRREHELAEREIQLVERELNMMILQQVIGKPTPKKRCGRFRKSRLKLLKASGCRNVSAPAGNVMVVTHSQETCTSRLDMVSCTRFFLYKFLAPNTAQLYSIRETCMHVTRMVSSDWSAAYRCHVFILLC